MSAVENFTPKSNFMELEKRSHFTKNTQMNVSLWISKERITQRNPGIHEREY